MLNQLKTITGLAVAAGLLSAGAAIAQDKYKVFLSMSYIGNDWQAESANMITAMAKSKTLRDKVDLEVQVAGANAQKQIQQINAMVQAGANAIIVFPISPTALNPVVKAACKKGVQVFAYESEITEPCAHNVSINNEAFGAYAADWLVKKLGGKGRVVYISGVPGVSADTQRTAGVMSVFDKNPGIEIIASGVGMWSDSVARSEMTKILASHQWNDIDGVLSQLGCFSIPRSRRDGLHRSARCLDGDRDRGDLQGLRADQGAERGGFRRPARDRPRAPGRERRGQVHAHQDHQRPPPARQRHDPRRRHPGRRRGPGRSPPSRHRDGFQELTQVRDLTVAQNLYLPYEPRRRFGQLRPRATEEMAAAHLGALGLGDISPRAEVGSLDLPQRQKLEIARAILRDPRVLLLDEPTSSLSGEDIGWLGDIIAQRKAFSGG